MLLDSYLVDRYICVGCCNGIVEIVLIFVSSLRKQYDVEFLLRSTMVRFCFFP